uniref:Uncharacterized protein n=1 Tax=Glycine max TaxID=3847 RepID=A0A0R0ERW8_SOYBN
MWAHTLSNPYLDVNADPCGHVKGSNFDHNRRFRSPLTPTSCSTFNALASLNMTSVGRSCISYSEIWSSLGSPYAGSAKIRLIHMGLLDHLWDDTVAGPRPENGLGKLRKHHTFTFRPSSGKGGKDSFRFRRRSASDAYEKRGQNRSGPSSPFDV